MTHSSDSIQTVEWRCPKCRAIPWDCQQWELNPATALLERDSQLHLDHHDSSIALEASAAAGCGLCINLRARVLHWLSDRGELPSGQCRLWFHRGVDIHFQIGDDYRHEVFEALVRSKSATWLPEWDDMPGPAPSPKSFLPETADDDLNALVRDSIKPWFNDCFNGNRLHRECRNKFKMDEIGAMPKRLIDVGDDQNSKARLIISEDEFGQALSEDEQVRYLILSYCWGNGNDPAKTTRANLASRLKHIDETELPKTIQDTIKVTRLLGFRYLWVDALCIIQSHGGDNYQDDFKAEAPKMGAYYTNAVCLISALGAPDSSTGLFVPRPAHRFPTSSCVIGFDTRTDEYIHLPPPRRALADEFDASPLLKRGWCFQERLLARRIIYWSRNGVFWNCVGDNATRSEFSSRCDEFVTDPRISNSCVFHGVQAPGTDWGLPWEPWMDYIHEYSSKAFSFAKDRLVAVHGLGSRLAAIHGGEYFGGVFSSHISWGIMWGADPENDAREKLDYFPSWSWASCQSDLGVIITDTTKPWVECATFGGFPAVQDPLDFQQPEKRMLRLNAPLLKFKPGQYQQGAHTSYDFEVAGVQFNAYYTYDTLDLAPTTQEDLYILVILLGRVQKGILLRAKGSMYERVGYTSLYYMDGPKGFKELSFWDGFRVDVEIV
ncbi:heterokaryon incompatibility protein-domain-containing protein [Fusarium solani]|uniref:Heterokaryon incompatibility protein-domain-containing protein n=1 Tax=Fusarium solani TaxID=169388 RepID=A0A9P9KUT9_FUSSL|nr:heterokaryon incompatibility protein-domain-containing protein [Fusarium solani]KAH7268788.1 heterokaryon incompatibility protein-domain-containing protein [Fusarium solani]